MFNSPHIYKNIKTGLYYNYDEDTNDIIKAHSDLSMMEYRHTDDFLTVVKGYREKSEKIHIKK